MFGLFGPSLEHLGVWDLGERCPPRSQSPGCVVMGPELNMCLALLAKCRFGKYAFDICNLFMITDRYHMSPGTGSIRVLSQEESKAILRGRLVRVGKKASVPSTPRQRSPPPIPKHRPKVPIKGSAAKKAKAPALPVVSKFAQKKTVPQSVDRKKFAYWICTIVGTCKSDCANMLITYAIKCYCG